MRNGGSGSVWVAWVALLALAGGCSAVTDFDFEFADGGAPPMDGGANADAGDAAMDAKTPPDAETDSGDDDGGGNDAWNDDGGLPPTCDAPCIGDAALDFDAETQRNPWAYLQDDRSAAGVGYADLVAGVYDGAPAWTASGAEPPTIVGCPLAPEVAPCAGVAGYLLFVPDATEDDGSDPAIELAIDSPGIYNIDVRARMPDGTTATEPVEILVSRTARPALLARRAFVPETTPTTFGAEATLLADERVVVTVRPDRATGPAPEPLAVNVRVTRVTDAALPGKCMLAVPFDTGASSLADRCVGAEGTEESGATGSDADSPSPTRFGPARQLDEGQTIAWDSLSLDYSGDFTIDLWIRTEDPLDLSATALSHESADAATPRLDTWTSSGAYARVTINDSDDTPYM
ncbi:MAG: hypothetical protein ACOCUS_04490, partial [Polyangiales bacterium]